MIEGLRYILSMMGFPITGPISVLCDNQSVVTNASRPESTLSKKHTAIAYHRCREAAAEGTLRFGFVRGMDNLADILTKCLDGPLLKHLARRIMY
jgi:hypothetical protein